MEPRAATGLAARIAAAAGVVLAIVGLILVFRARPPDPSAGPDGLAGAGTGIETAFQTIVGGILLVTGALVGVTSALLWLLAERRARRLR